MGDQGIVPGSADHEIGPEAAHREAIAREDVLGGPDEELEAAALRRRGQGPRARLVGREDADIGLDQG